MEKNLNSDYKESSITSTDISEGIPSWRGKKKSAKSKKKARSK